MILRTKTISFLLVTFLFFSCSKDNESNNTQEETPINEPNQKLNITEITPKKGYPGDLIKLTWEGEIFSNQNLNIELSDILLEIIELNDNDLTFIIPNNLSSGKLKLEIGNLTTTSEFELEILKKDIIEHTPIYFLVDGDLWSYNFDEKLELKLVEEINKGLARSFLSEITYNPSNSSFIGFSNSLRNEFLEGYNIISKELIRKNLCECSNYKSIIFNTKSNQLILAKGGENSVFDLIFQEIDSVGNIILETPIIEIKNTIISDINYSETIDSYFSVSEYTTSIEINVFDANTYEQRIIKIEGLMGLNSSNSIGDSADLGSDVVTFDKINNKIYYLRGDGVYELNLKEETFEKIETDFVEFYKSNYDNDDINLVKSLYYPPTNEIIFLASGLFGNRTGSNQFFGINLTTKKTRKIPIENGTFDSYDIFSIAIKD